MRQRIAARTQPCLASKSTDIFDYVSFCLKLACLAKNKGLSITPTSKPRQPVGLLDRVDPLDRTQDSETRYEVTDVPSLLVVA